MASIVSKDTIACHTLCDTGGGVGRDTRRDLTRDMPRIWGRRGGSQPVTIARTGSGGHMGGPVTGCGQQGGGAAGVNQLPLPGPARATTCEPMSVFAFGSGGPCLPSPAKVPPSGPQWVHEIKHDGYRLLVRRTWAGVRIRTRRGYDWTDRFPLIVEAASQLQVTSFVLDGEGVVLRPDGVSDFDALHGRRRDPEVQLLAFDLLELDGTDRRPEPLERSEENTS